MLLLSLTVRNYRVHKDLTVTFDPSRNLIGGPNESGKSTLAEAAHRALFLRAKTGGNLHKEMLSTRHLGDPEVLLSFQAAGSRWDLEKRFAAAKGATRLTAHGGSTLRDEEAETKLAELLKSETAGGRAAPGLLPELWSHLWVWQGKAGDDPSAHTSRHKEHIIRHLQQDGVAAVLQSATDQRAAARIASSYAELFTSTGKPKAGSKPELARLQAEAALAALEQARQASTRLAQAAEDHSRAEQDIAEISSLLPKLRSELQATETSLRQVASLRLEEQSRLQAHQTAAARLQELENHHRTLLDLQTKLAAQTAALQPAEHTLATLTATLEKARSASQTADSSHLQAAETLRRARLHHDLANAAVTAFEKDAACQLIANRATQAATLQDELADVRSALAKLPAITPADLRHIRKLDTEAGQAAAALQAMATGIELSHDAPSPVQLDGSPLAPGESRILTADGELLTADGTRLRIRPGGGTSLAAARSRASAARQALTTALEALTIPHLELAASILEQRQTLNQKIEHLTTRWQSLGGESITTALATATAALNTAREDLLRRQSAANLPPPASPDEAHSLLTRTRAELTRAETTETNTAQHAAHLRQQLATAEKSLQLHQEQTAAARRSLQDLKAAIHAREETHGPETSRLENLSAARHTLTLAETQLNTTRQSLATLHPDLLQADLQRFQRAISSQEQRLREAENTRLIARERLTLDGSNDPEADLRQAEARHRAAHALASSEQRRAKAIETLHNLFTSSREAIDRALVQPLADRISGYLVRLFGPGAEARVKLSDSGIEGLELIRPGSPACPFSALSGGTREQCAAAVRLALAEILAADHDHHLPILFDDAFAFSDPHRIQALQRMLDLAATRGLQIIILTCTPSDYSAFGARECILTPNHQT